MFFSSIINLCNFSKENAEKLRKQIGTPEMIAKLNMYKEWFSPVFNQQKETHLYWAKVKNNSKLYKIGISNDLKQRPMAYGNSGCFNYKSIRIFKNRFCAAYVEYKIKIKYCIGKTEFINKKDLQKVIKLVNHIHWNNEVKQDLIKLGWVF